MTRVRRRISFMMRSSGLLTGMRMARSLFPLLAFRTGGICCEYPG